MSALETAFATWIAFHSELDVDMQRFLRAPATEQEIRQVESSIGYELPDDLRDLYRLANGQIGLDDIDQWSEENSDYAGRWAPFFGNQEFLPLEKALESYNFWRESYESDNDFRQKYNEANPDSPSEPVEWEERDGDVVDAFGWNPMWFSFAGLNADNYSVDLSPPRGGMPGQVVLHGADEHVLQVVASSVTELLQQASEQLDPEEPHRFDRSEEREIIPVATVFFNMDWRVEPYNPDTARQFAIKPPGYTQWLEQQEQSRKQRQDNYRAWLATLQHPQSFSPEDIDSIVLWTETRLLLSNHQRPPVHVLAEIRDYAASIGEKISNWFAGSNDAEQNTINDTSSHEFRNHLISLASTLLLPEHLFGSMLPIPRLDALSLYHQFLQEQGEWSTDQQERAATFINEIEHIAARQPGTADDPVRSFNMTSSGSTLEICFSTFNPETYKSGEDCHTVDMTKYN